MLEVTVTGDDEENGDDDCMHDNVDVLMVKYKHYLRNSQLVPRCPVLHSQ